MLLVCMCCAEQFCLYNAANHAAKRRRKYKCWTPAAGARLEQAGAGGNMQGNQGMQHCHVATHVPTLYSGAEMCVHFPWILRYLKLQSEINCHSNSGKHSGKHSGTASTAGEHALPHLEYSRLGALASCRGHRPFQMHSGGSSRMSARCMHARCKHQQSGMWKASHIFNPCRPEASPGTMPSSFSLTHLRGQVWRGSCLPAGAVVRHSHLAGSSRSHPPHLPLS